MNPTPTNPRLHAIALLNAILGQGHTLDAAQAHASFAGTPADAAFARHLVLSVLRHLGQLDALLARYIDSPIASKHHPAQHALRLGAAQLLLLDTPAHAAVHETVAAVKLTRSAALSGLANAVLQKIAAERPKLPSPGHNLPAWWGTRLDVHYGADAARAIAAVAAQRPPLDVNLPASATMESGARMDDCIWRLPPEHAPVDSLPGFAEGAFFVQDIAASYPARLLGDVSGQQVLDLCAAPGGKAMQLARAGANVVALDRSEQRLQRLQQNMLRTKLSVQVVTADALTWEPDEMFDAILLDAPCSATGTWRRHPEVVRLASFEKIAELAALQRALLARAWQWLKPGGRLVYCTCSLEPEEGEQQIAAFLAGHADAQLAPIASLSSPLAGERGLPLQTRGGNAAEPTSPPPNPQADLTPPQGGSGPKNIPAQCITPEGTLRTLPSMMAEQGGMDGFFAAVLVKRN
ncbi:MAG: transcription antitermination factor NusB [Rickettsiales bacterium]